VRMTFSCYSPNHVRVIKSQILGRREYIARIGARRGSYKVLVGKLYKDLGVGRRIILKRIFKKKNGGVDWIDRAQDRHRWRALVNVLMNPLFP